MYHHHRQLNRQVLRSSLAGRFGLRHVEQGADDDVHLSRPHHRRGQSGKRELIDRVVGYASGNG